MRSSTNRRAPTGRPHGQAIGGRIGRRRPPALAFGVAVAVAAAMSAAATTAAAAPGRQAPSRSPVSLDPIVGAVYVDGNTAPTNSVAGYYRHADGSLTTIPGSPFAVGGAGTGRATASQGALQLSADGRYLLAVDAQSAQISVLRVRADGSLGSVDGSPFSSGGGNPVSIAVHDGLVYVANADANQPNYTGFTLDDRGQLTPIAGSTVSLPAGS